MQSFLLWTFLWISFTTSDGSRFKGRFNDTNKAHGRVIGGKDANEYQFPHQVQIRLKKRNELQCGGSIFKADDSTETLIISAAHCFKGTRASDWEIIANALYTDLYVYQDKVHNQRRNVREILVHPCFNGDTFSDMSHDIALLFLEKELDYDKDELMVKPIGLPKFGEIPKGEAIVLGWGRTKASQAKVAERLQMVKVPIVPLVECRRRWKKALEDAQKETGQEITEVVISEYMMCASGIKGKDACQGDSGGGLLAFGPNCGEDDMYLAGVISFGPEAEGCALDIPGVYVNVQKYVCWILYREWPKDCNSPAPICPATRRKERDRPETCGNDMTNMGRGPSPQRNQSSLISFKFFRILINLTILFCINIFK